MLQVQYWSISRNLFQ